MKLRVFRSNKQSFSCEKLMVFRSNKHIYGQIIDEGGKTLVSVSTSNLSNLTNWTNLKKTEKAKAVGVALAQAAKKAKIEAVVFDRGKFRYHGRVQALAEGARSGGLKF